MYARLSLSPGRLVRSLAFAALALVVALATTASGKRPDSVVAGARDGSHDFDFEIGSWHTQLKRLKEPLSGSTTWLEYEGTTTVRAVMGGRANLVELSAQGASGRFDGTSLRLYDPAARQWSLNFANVTRGSLATPSVGQFIDGRGEFYSYERYRDRFVLVRFVIQRKGEDTIGFEQAFSVDGGRSWEVNWIATDTRTDSVRTALPEELPSAVRAYGAATMRNDVAALAGLVTDDYVLVNSDSSLQNKQSYLDDFRRPGFAISAYTLEEPIYRIWGEAALVGGILRLTWMQDGIRHRRTLRIAHWWVQRQGHWQIAYTQLTRVPSADEVGS
jgi:ketosteroid isomerase-like protein